MGMIWKTAQTSFNGKLQLNGRDLQGSRPEFLSWATNSSHLRRQMFIYRVTGARARHLYGERN